MSETLTERRKQDRALMAGTVAELARVHGLDVVVTGEQHGSRETSASVTGPHGLRLTVRFRGTSPQAMADTYVLCWHGVEPPWRLAPGAFGDVNPHHGHKATDVVHGFAVLKELLGRRFAAITDGSAFEGSRTPPPAGPGRVLVVGTDSGWREYAPSQPAVAGELVLPYPQGISAYDPQDRGALSGARVWSITDPRRS